MSRLFAALFLLTASFTAAASPYTPARASNAPKAMEARKTADGTVEYVVTNAPAAADSWGNAAGNQYDLVVDGAFEGQTVAVLHLYTGEGFDFSLPKAALGEKGFNVVRWVNQPPPVEELQAGLAKSSQLWVVSGPGRTLTDAHLDVIDEFFDSGRGVYIWGDNEPYYADANAVADRLFGGRMTGNLPGTVTVGVQHEAGKPGVARGHDITTGLEHLYEGVTIATLDAHPKLQPLVVGSAGNVVTAVYDHDGKRAVLDGGFTRLFINWDTAGTSRYVKNAAAWLVNYERFGEAVLPKEPLATR
ncbi:MAG: hypothetical protein R3F61_23915 [Myxococcota bacterium]